MSLRRKPSERAELLAGVPFFDGFSPEDLRRVVELSDELVLSAGGVLVDQGDPGTHCYVIVEGIASVYVRGEHVASVGAGSMVTPVKLSAWLICWVRTTSCSVRTKTVCLKARSLTNSLIFAKSLKFWQSEAWLKKHSKPSLMKTTPAALKRP